MLFSRILPILPVFYFAFYIAEVNAQTGLPGKKSSLVNTIWIQYNPGTLLEPELPVTATVLYKQSKRVGFALDAGFFIARQNYSSQLSPYGGFRFKPEVKFYLEKNHNGPHGLYFSLQGLVKRTIKTNEDWIDQLDSMGQFLFSRQALYQERKLVLGVNLLFGGEVILDYKNRWALDFYIGLGVRNKSFKALNLPPGISKDYQEQEPGRTFSIYRNGVYMSIPLGIKIGCRIS